MKAIYKYVVDPERVLEDMRIPVAMPPEAETLSCGAQSGRMVIWAMVNHHEPKKFLEPQKLVDRYFYVFPTGVPIDTEKVGDFVGTVQIPEAFLVFHVFEAA